MSAGQVFGAGLLGTVAVAIPLLIVGAIVSHDVDAPKPDHTDWAGVHYGGDPEAEAALVELEERHLADVRSTVGTALWDGGGPYHLRTSETTAFVLVPHSEPYTLDQLVSIAPETMSREKDGSYLLSESLVVLSGASLNITNADGVRLLLTSTADSFVSITTLGGTLTVQGSEEHPAQVSSWDPAAGGVDEATQDGRAYIRVLGGQADFAFAEFDHLGFWSGATGGVALTGTSLPSSDALASSVGSASMTLVSWQEEPAPGPTATPSPTPTPRPSSTPPPGSPNEPGSGGGAGSEETESDEVRTLELEPDYSGHVKASANISSTTFSNNAFGLFVSGAENVVVADSMIRDSLVDGLLFFRDVTASSVTATTSQDNGADGFKLASSTTGVVLDGVTASGNGRNGISVEGSALVDGPNPTGSSTAQYGDNSVTGSTVTDNERYGIEVVGGNGVTIDDNSVSGSTNGIVVATGAQAVTVSNNTIENAAKQGIALREAGRNLVVEGNAVSGAEVGIFVRNAGGDIRDNRIEKASMHAISLVGSTGLSSVTNNTVSGVGPSAVDVVRTKNASVSGNNAAGWEGTKPVDVTMRSIFQPLTVLWIVLGTLVFITAFLGIGRRKRQRQLQDRRAPLSSFTRGVVTPEQARALATARATGQPPALGMPW